MSERSRRVCILLKNGLGDVIMALPLIRTHIRAGDRLLLVVKSSSERNIIDNEFPERERIGIECVGAYWKRIGSGMFRLASVLRKFRPHVLLLPHATNRIGMSVFASMVRAKATVAPSSRVNDMIFDRTIAPREKEHKVNYYLRFSADEVKGYGENAGPRITVHSECADLAQEFLFARKRGLTWIAFAPGSGVVEAHKRWSPSRYIQLGEGILNRNSHLGIAILGNPSEKALVHGIVQGLERHGSRIVEIVQKDVLFSAAIIALCKCIVTGCSGAAHIAAAVGTPILGLYGPTNPGLTGPYTDQRRIIRMNFRCSPCYRVGFIRGCGDPVCMSMIECDTVEGAMMHVLDHKFDDSDHWYCTTRARRPDLRKREAVPF